MKQFQVEALMRRAVGVTMVALVALLIMQFVAIRRMRLEISRLRADAAALAIDSRQDEIVRTGMWLHTWLAEQASRSGGLCPNGAPDIATINKALFGTYLHARAGGTTEAQAREEIISTLK